MACITVRKFIIKSLVCFLLFFKQKKTLVYAKLQLAVLATYDQLLKFFFQKKHLLVVGRMRIREAQKFMVPTNVQGPHP
jgi:hypothetical protein